MEAKKKKILLIGLGVGALGALGFLGYRHYLKLKESGGITSSSSLKEPIFPTYSPPASTSNSKPASSASSSIVKASDGFPLKKGSKGEMVKQLQQALINAFGAMNGGADGIFGPATEGALKKGGYPIVVDQTTFYVITQSSGSSFDPKQLGTQLYQAAMAKNLSKVLELLKKIKSVSDYSSVSEAFKVYRINAVRMTLVNGLLSVFTTESDKQQIRMQFTRMGLKYDGKAWSLSGIEANHIITIKPAVVWKDSTTPITVPSNMVLGTPISEKNGYVLFQSLDNLHQFIIQSNAIKLL